MDKEMEQEERLREGLEQEREEVLRTERVRELNDELRTRLDPLGALIAGGQFVITSGVVARGNTFIDRAVAAVRNFSDFTEDNDPYSEHDFGIFELDGVALNWKVDYYDRAMEYGSPDPSDPSVTKRVLTILLAEEY